MTQTSSERNEPEPAGGLGVGGRRLVLAAMMVIVAVITATIALATTSRVARHVSETHLRDLVATRAAVAEAVWQRTDDRAAALEILAEAQERTPRPDSSVEVVIGEMKGDRIHVLLRPAGEEVDPSFPGEIPLSADVAGPLQLALQGRTGTVMERDDGGIAVLGAYRPIPSLGWGIVAKMDQADVRAPFQWAFAVTAAAGALLIAVGMVAFLRVSEPMLRELEASEERSRALYHAERQAREALRERERLLDAVLEALPVGVWLAGADGTLLRGNPAARKIWQGARDADPATHGEYRGWRRATGEPVAPGEGALDRAARGEATVDEEIEIECCDGTRKVILSSATPVRDEEGTIRNAVVTNHDITERIRAEERLAATVAELERSNAELQRFAYVASHDLQEPLRMVSSFTQLLSRRYAGRLDQEAGEYIAYAVDGAKRMQTLIDDLLRLSRIGTHGRPFEPVDCAAVVEQSRRDMAMTLEEAGAVVTADPLPLVHGDAGQLGQLFQNLLTNALRFRGEATPRVHVSAERHDGEWVFCVRDNGIGIAPEHFERIFLIFQRLHSRDEFPGTGIGLALCRKIVERHEGRIWVESSPGQGSSFRFTLPAAERSAP